MSRNVEECFKTFPDPYLEMDAFQNSVSYSLYTVTSLVEFSYLISIVFYVTVRLLKRRTNKQTPSNITSLTVQKPDSFSSHVPYRAYRTYMSICCLQRIFEVQHSLFVHYVSSKLKHECTTQPNPTQPMGRVNPWVYSTHGLG